MDSIMESPKRLARTAGVLYLFVAVFGAFALLFVDRKVYVAGDAANHGREPGRERRARACRRRRRSDPGDALGLRGDGPLPAAQARQQERRERHGGARRDRSRHHHAQRGLPVREPAGRDRLGAGFGAASDSLALLLLDTQHYGVLIAQVFFGLWLVPMGYLAYKSGWFPKALGVLLIVGGASYLVDTLALFLVPDFGAAISVYGRHPGSHRRGLDGRLPAP